jgi:hypothetical protein
MSDNESRRATLDDILEELKSQRSKKKDFWDRLGPISTAILSVVLGFAGLWFTHSYNMAQIRINERQGTQDQETKRQQARVLEMQAVEKFIPYLTTGDEKKKEVALLVITTLGSPEFATQFAKLNPSKGTEAAADRIMASAQPSNQGELPQSITAKPATSQSQTGIAQTTKKLGWVYLGHYVAAERRWETRYFEFGNTVDPSTLPTSVLTVREATGAINVRIGMPSTAGVFQRVQNVLKPPSQVTVHSIKEWYSTGYMWAEVEYET